MTLLHYAIIGRGHNVKLGETQANVLRVGPHVIAILYIAIGADAQRLTEGTGYAPVDGSITCALLVALLYVAVFTATAIRPNALLISTNGV